MKPTDTRDPSYFHKVVDCQWACPAHTNVPEYIRLIAQGRYTDAYLVNRQSNVFPGILGRTCDRPCEPACRRTRVDGEPVAICRLKRVAADLRDDISEHLPHAPIKQNGKRIACIGAGPASLAVANDLAPLGYEVVMFEKSARAGGLMRTNVPSFRLPEKVLNEEIDMILNMGVDIRYGTPVSSLKSLLKGEFDAVFVGTGAPRGKDLELPGRKEAGDRVHIGIEWLEGVAFEHIKSIGEKVLIIGVGNTAMDCCRTSRRLGGKEIKVMARRPRQFFKASPWELEDAEEELIEIVVNHSPKRFVVEDGKLRGMEFERLEWSEDAQGKATSKVVETVFIPADDVIVAIGQENAFPWIERDSGVAFDKSGMPVIDKVTFQSSVPGVFFGGDAAWGPKNIIWAVAHAHEAAISIHNHCQGLPVSGAPPGGDEPHHPEDGPVRVELQQRLQPRPPRQDEARRSARALSQAQPGSGDGLRRRSDHPRGGALPELRHRDVVQGQAVHRVRRLRGHLPHPVSDHHPQRGRAGAAGALDRARQEHRAGAVRVGRPAADRPHHGQGRRRVCPLWPVRGALPNGGVGHGEIRADPSSRGTKRCI